MENLPYYISMVFGLTTILTVFLFYKATGNSKKVLAVILVWMVIQTLISATGFYTTTNSRAPRLLFLVIPPIVFIVVQFLTTKGRTFIDSLNIKYLTLMYSIRIPVEIVLFWLFLHKTIPQLMTFEGRNFDILAGISAPVIYYYGFIKYQLNNKIILIWNFVCLGLLFNIVTNAILSMPYPFQQFAFDQPNVALLHFPFIWLPGVIVPIVLLSQLASIRILIKEVRKPEAFAIA
jgi:hypothetical protein